MGKLCNRTPLSRKKRQFPPIIMPGGGGGGTLPPGLQIPCICCQNCEDLKCSAALPGHVCADEKIAKENITVELDNCQTRRCTPLAGQGPCLCCPVKVTTTTMEPTITTTTAGETPVPMSTTTTTTAATPTTTTRAPTTPTMPSTTTWKPTTTREPTPSTAPSTTTMVPNTTTMAPTTTTPPPTCPKSTCCSATYLQGGTCTETKLLTNKVKKSFCSKSKICTNSIGVFDKKCTCCKNCKEHKTCKKKKGKCVDPATVNWVHWNFDFCYRRNVKCIKRSDGINCVCCGWRNPKQPHLGEGQNAMPPVQ